MIRALTIAAACLFAPAPAWGWTELKSDEEAPVLMLEKGRSTVIRSIARFSTIVVADPNIAEAMPTTDNSFFLRGKTPGSTTVLLYDRQGEIIEMIDVQVALGLDALRADLDRLLPGERIEVYPILDGIFVDGHATTAHAAELAIQLAERHLPGGVANGLSVRESQQVLLEVRFLEASRTALKEIGFDTAFGTPRNFFTSDGSLISGVGATAVAGFTSIGGANIDISLEALEEQGIIRTLAEPNLVALSGDTASFLAGGEFPIPIAAGDDQISVEFRDFGVSLEFTPVVLGDGLINLHVAPEVSALDPTAGITSTGLSVPGLTIRRADTRVELRDGQAFAIAGLLQNSYSNSVRKTPWVANVPVLGALFSSKRFERNETELVIIITPHLVQPAPSPDYLQTPLDYLGEPSEAEFLLLDRTADYKPTEGVRP